MGLLGGLIGAPPVDMEGLVLCIFGGRGLLGCGSLGLAFDGGIGSPERGCGHYIAKSIGGLVRGLWCQLLTSEAPSQAGRGTKSSHCVWGVSCIVSGSEAKMKLTVAGSVVYSNSREPEPMGSLL